MKYQHKTQDVKMHFCPKPTPNSCVNSSEMKWKVKSCAGSGELALETRFGQHITSETVGLQPNARRRFGLRNDESLRKEKLWGIFAGDKGVGGGALFCSTL